MFTPPLSSSAAMDTHSPVGTVHGGALQADLHLVCPGQVLCLSVTADCV